MDKTRQYIAEFLGTALLVFTGVGAAVVAGTTGGVVVVGLAFGLAMLVLAYALAPVSGAHLNPAVTLGTLISGKISLTGAVGYWIAQVLGGIAGAFVLFGLVRWARVTDETGTLGANQYGTHINAGGAIVVEFLLTFLFVLVVLLVYNRTEQASIRGVAIGLALGLANLVAFSLDGASINPARSIGPALFNGGTPLRQLWLFVVIPLVAGAAAAACARMFPTPRAEPGGRPVDWRAMDVRRDETSGRTERTPASRSTPSRRSTRR